jgi:hypothetical protein
MDDLYFGGLNGMLYNMVNAYDMGQYHQTMRVILKLDELAFEVLANSNCSQGMETQALKLLMESKEPIFSN